MRHRKSYFVKRLRALAYTASLIGFLSLEDGARADSLADFFKAVGNSIAHPGQSPKPKPRENKGNAKRGSKGGGTAASAVRPDASAVASPQESPVVATPAPTPLQVAVRVASVVTDTKSSKRDIPYGIPVPNKPGFVTSPFAPNQGFVDVRGFTSGTRVTDPYTGKMFLTP